MSSIAIIGRPVGIRLRHMHWTKKPAGFGGGRKMTSQELRDVAGSPQEQYQPPSAMAKMLAIMTSPFQRVFGRRKV